MLLVLPSKSEAYPLAVTALVRAQGEQKQILRDYADAVIVEADGTLRRFERIEFLGPYGQTPIHRLLSRFTNTWSITVTLSDCIEGDFLKLKEIVISAFDNRITIDSFGIQDAALHERLVLSLKQARKGSELIGASPLPAPEEALDIL